MKVKNSNLIISPQMEDLSPKTNPALKKVAQATGNIAASALSMASGVVASPLVSMATGSAAASTTLGGKTNSELDTMKAMHSQNQQFSMDFLKIQMELQAENRRYTTLSNIEKAKHDTAKGAIHNIRT